MVSALVGVTTLAGAFGGSLGVGLLPSTAVGAAAPSAASGVVPSTISPWDWPSYGHDAQHTFHGRTTLTASSVTTLRTAWFLPDRRRGDGHTHRRR